MCNIRSGLCDRNCRDTFWKQARLVHETYKSWKDLCSGGLGATQVSKFGVNPLFNRTLGLSFFIGLVWEASVNSREFRCLDVDSAKTGISRGDHRIRVTPQERDRAPRAVNSKWAWAAHLSWESWNVLKAG